MGKESRLWPASFKIHPYEVYSPTRMHFKSCQSMAIEFIVIDTAETAHRPDGPHVCVHHPTVHYFVLVLHYPVEAH